MKIIADLVAHIEALKAHNFHLADKLAALRQRFEGGASADGKSKTDAANAVSADTMQKLHDAVDETVAEAALILSKPPETDSYKSALPEVTAWATGMPAIGIPSATTVIKPPVVETVPIPEEPVDSIPAAPPVPTEVTGHADPIGPLGTSGVPGISTSSESGPYRDSAFDEAPDSSSSSSPSTEQLVEESAKAEFTAPPPSEAEASLAALHLPSDSSSSSATPTA